MPNSNGRIYRDETTTPPKGVSFADVQTVLGTTVNTESGLCTHENINKWARWKPVPFASISPLTWRQNANSHFGLQIIQSNSESGLIEKLKGYVQYLEHSTSSTTYQGYSDGVKYTKPSGGMNSCSRISDFACKEFDRLGYHHSAELQWAAPKGNNLYTSALGAVLGEDEYIYNDNDGSALPQFDSFDDEWDCWDGALNPESFIGNYTPNVTPLNLDLSAQEIIMSCVLTPTKTDLYRGVVLIEEGATVYLSQFHWDDDTEIPWKEWKDELVLVEDWWRFEVYSMTGQYCIIPGMEKKISFSLGGNSIAFIVLGEENNVAPAPVSNNKARVDFRCVAGNVNDWYNIRIQVTKIIGNTESTPYFNKNLNELDTYTSGDLYYWFEFGLTPGVDNWTVQPTDRFKMRIYGQLFSSSSESVVSEKVLTLEA